MEIEILGYILIPIGILMLFMNSKYLVYSTVFFSTFTGSSVLCINNNLAIQPAYFFAILLIIKESLKCVKNSKITIPDNKLLLFVFLSILSVINANFLKDVNEFIINQDSQLVKIGFSSSNITQLMYILFCFITYIVLKNFFSKNPKEINKSIKALIYSTIVITLLGIYQEIAYIFGLEFDKIFRSNAHGNIQPFGKFVRIYSVTNEPSMFAVYLVAILAFLVSYKSDFKYVKIIISLVIFNAIFTTSTTFIVGFIVFILKTIYDHFFVKNGTQKNAQNKIMKNIIVIVILAMIFIILLMNFIPEIIERFYNTTVDKFSGKGISASVRTSDFNRHLSVGLNHPILGVGFGTARSKDLFSTWICNVGIIATAIFIIYVLSIINKLKKTGKQFNIAISNFIFVLVVCLFISVPEPYYLYMWYMFALAEVQIQLNEGENNENSIHNN